MFYNLCDTTSMAFTRTDGRILRTSPRAVVACAGVSPDSATAAIGGVDVSAQGVHGNARARVARRNPADGVRNARHPGRGRAGSEPCANADRSRAGAPWHAHGTYRADQSAMAAADGGRAGAGDVPRAKRLHLARLVCDQAADRQGG